jgi:hypothetical protein
MPSSLKIIAAMNKKRLPGNGAGFADDRVELGREDSEPYFRALPQSLTK